MINPIVVGPSFVVVYLSITWFDTSIEEIGLFLIMVIRLLPNMKELAKTGQSMRGTMPAFNAVVQRLESMENERETRGGARMFAGLSRAISFDDVSFAYDGNHAAPALRNVSAEIVKGTLTALVGPSGAGKIAHRLATVAMADQILVLDRGRLVARGTHTELMRSGGWYASAFSAQQDISPPTVSELTFASA